MAISEVRIEAVRGIRRELLLRLQGKSALIVGDNGAGKTSIVRGMLWALRGEEEPTPEGSAGTEAAYRRHVLEPVTAPHVRVDLHPVGRLEVRPGSVDSDDAGRALRESCLRSSPFLLRRQLLEVFSARPIDRFRYLESFLDVGGADEVWTSLAGRSRELDDQATRDAQRLEREVIGIAAALPVPDRNGVTTWAGLHAALCARLTALGLRTAPQDGWTSVVSAGERALALAQPEAIQQRRAQLVAAAAAVEEMRGVLAEPVADDVTRLEAERAALVARLPDAAVLDLLEHARLHFSARDEGDACPVCGNAIDRVTLLERLESRIAALRSLDVMRGRLKHAGTAWAARWLGFLDSCRRVSTALGLRSLNEIAGRPEPPASATALAQAPAADPAAFLSELLHSDPAGIESWMQALYAFLADHVRSAQSTLPPEGASEDLRALSATITRASDARDHLQALGVRVAQAQLDSGRLALFAEAIRASRQDYAKSTLDSIAAKVRDYYLKVHPADERDEVTGPPTITVRRQREGTAYVGGSFNDREVSDPRWVYSDGHLDTVGICIFLALRRHCADAESDCKLIVLDDIVLSVDLTHARRLIAVLKEDFRDHQVLAFTHNALFAHWYAGLVPGVRRFRVTDWTLESGPQIGDYEGALTRLEQTTVEAAEPKEIGQAIQALMDEWLHEARYVYGLAIPAQRGDQYTMAELWEPFVSLLRRAMTTLHRCVDTDLPMLARIGDLPRIRNSLAAHENEFAREYPLATIRQIARDVAALVRALYCLACGTYVTPIPNARQASIMHCSCRALRFLPV